MIVNQKKIFFILPILIIYIFVPFSARAQTNWVKHPTPVVLRSASFPDWKGLAAADAYVMKDNDTLKMWYSGSGWVTSTDDCPHVRMGYAWSLNGIVWNDYSGNPVLNIGSNISDFDYDGVETPTIIKDTNAPANQRYKLWYAGRNARCQSVNDHQFGYAYSPDGINWTKYAGNPVMSAGASGYWYNTFISNPSVIKEGNTYKMWFTAPDLVVNGQPTDGKGNIGYATSSDGATWNINPTPVLIAGDQNNWDSASIAEPSVLKIGNTYHMFYSALDQWTVENFQIGYATSSDGINWIKSTQNPVLKIGNTIAWDKFWAAHPGAIYDNTSNKFRMWYTGRDTANISALTGYYWDIGYAESDFITETPNQLSESNNLPIYPNPANAELIIGTPNKNDNFNLIIYDAQGRMTTSYKINEQENININTSKFESGFYFFILTNIKTIYKGKFIVLH